MNARFQNYISGLLNETITSLSPVSGGDISQAYKLKTPHHIFLLKVNTSESAFNMFQAEANALKRIENTKTIKTPQIICYDGFENHSFLILEYIANKSPSNINFKTFGAKLAELHQVTQNCFGLDEDNFIGSLKQRNKTYQSWLEFYKNERLLPQLELAKQSGHLSDAECPSESKIQENLNNLFENIKPSLLHGDLWSGNYLISTKGDPYLIDPALYFGHHEVDIAMTKLFGGFGNAFYKSYHSILPEDRYTPTRIEVYQLYYLLVHLNLFGRSYHNAVSTILKKHFS
ncbi:fructosamine kinase family protein [Yeosuana marina]|uniref:fructosamine kinase family protein n=1 Tax=Yeosuana marina TaxID=1565536 RepID=UPI0030EB71E1|tara:strand:- start:33833 stop:34696 length:864 start_codon:yes stop_codon:yes gene_type:complete